MTEGRFNDSDRDSPGKIYCNAPSVFESGSGESTKIASYDGVPQYTGVYSDAIYIDRERGSNMNHSKFYLIDGR